MSSRAEPAVVECGVVSPDKEVRQLFFFRLLFFLPVSASLLQAYTGQVRITNDSIRSEKILRS